MDMTLQADGLCKDVLRGLYSTIDLESSLHGDDPRRHMQVGPVAQEEPDLTRVNRLSGRG